MGSHIHRLYSVFLSLFFSWCLFLTLSYLCVFSQMDYGYMGILRWTNFQIASVFPPVPSPTTSSSSSSDGKKRNVNNASSKKVAKAKAAYNSRKCAVVTYVGQLFSNTGPMMRSKEAEAGTSSNKIVNLELDLNLDLGGSFSSRNRVTNFMQLV